MRDGKGRGAARAAAVLGVATLAAACGSPQTDGREAAARREPAVATRTVRTAAVVREETGVRTVAAAVVARDRATLSARTSATLVALPFREGDAVAAGAVVARLDDQALRAALAAAESDAAAADAERARAEALLAKSAATPREAELARARAEGARAAVRGAREALDYTALRAPFAGRVAARPAYVGDVVSPGMPILEIEGTGGLEVKADVTAEEAARLAPGTRVSTMVDGQPAALAAVVRSLSPAGDPATHRFELRADLPANASLRSGLFARLVLPGDGGDARLLVPASAAFARGGLVGVFVASEGRARLRWIAAGATADGRTEVRAGLAMGERVVVEPAGLEDGTPLAEAR